MYLYIKNYFAIHRNTRKLEYMLVNISGIQSWVRATLVVVCTNCGKPKIVVCSLICVCAIMYVNCKMLLHTGILTIMAYQSLISYPSHLEVGRVTI